MVRLETGDEDGVVGEVEGGCCNVSYVVLDSCVLVGIPRTPAVVHEIGIRSHFTLYVVHCTLKILR